MVDFKLFPRIDLSDPCLVIAGIATERQRVDDFIHGLKMGALNGVEAADKSIPRHLILEFIGNITGYVEDHHMHLRIDPAYRRVLTAFLDWLQWTYEVTVIFA
jgi:hypothetical protein